MLQWSKYFQNPLYMEMTRKFLIMEEMQPLLRKFCHIEEGMKILDVGCGTGFFSRFLLGDSKEIQITGIDADKTFIDYAITESKKQNKDIAFVYGDALNLPFEDNSFDVVVSHTFFTSINDPQKALEEMQRVCKKDGYICSVTAMSFAPQVLQEGKYPLECFWSEDYKRLEEKLWSVYEYLNPTIGYIGGIHTEGIPKFFVDNGLKEVSVYPIGKAFSLSNEAFRTDDRREYIIKMYEADLEKINNFEKLNYFHKYISKEDIAEYKKLSEVRKEYLLEHVENNTIWEWEGGGNCLVIGKSNHHESLEISEKPTLIDVKFKDSKPEETVDKIKGILKKVGITTNEIWNDSHVEGCYSLRIEIQGSKIGQNGKGMTKEFALASGYAELMERIQTGYFYVGNQDDELAAYKGFTYIPEEVYLTVNEVLEENEIWLQKLYHSVLEESNKYFTEKYFLEMLVHKKYAVTDKDFIAIPFYEIKTGKKVHIPTVILEDYYATNGTCAGNSVNEAIVQGLSEIVERHNNLKIHRKCITPPTVPEDYLKKFNNIYEVITSIRKQKRYELVIKDCSFTEGFPVVASVLIDRYKQTYIVKFGAHPLFEIALERSMTELFQGRNLESAAAVSGLLYDIADTQKIDIIHNVLKNATGKYHYNFFSEEADYEFLPSEDRSQMSNEELKKYAINFFSEKGYDIYLRNASYLGFYTFQIIVPAYSEIYNNGALRLKEKISHERAASTVIHLSEATDNECKNLITYIRYKECFALENTLGFLLMLPLNTDHGVKMSYLVYFIACLKIKNYSNAKKISDILLHFPLRKEELEYFKCFGMYLTLLEKEEQRETITECLERFFDPSVVDMTLRDFENTNLLIEKYGFSCKDYQCPECENNWCCDYRKLKDVIMKLKDYYKRTTPLEQEILFCDRLMGLTKCEQIVAEYYIQGYTRKETADKLFISENTVKKHLISIYKKVGTNKRVDVYNAVKTY